jgi:lipoate-protein ligase A
MARKSPKEEKWMIVLLNENNSPQLNLAAEECFLFEERSFQGAVMLWRNQPSVIVGRYQNTMEEICYPLVKALGLPVVRRLSGGGAVYHDLGNVNFTFFHLLRGESNFSIKVLVDPIIEALRFLGIPAEQTGRNDITVEGKKISGNAQYLSGDRFLHHGTILFRTDLDMMSEILQADPEKYLSKGVKSIRSRVANVSDFLKEGMPVEEFCEVLMRHIAGPSPWKTVTYFTDHYEEILKIAKERYYQQSWNYGVSPPYNFKNSKTLSSGKVEIRLNIREGRIENIKIYGDFLPTVDTLAFESCLKGKSYDENELYSVLSADSKCWNFISDLGLTVGDFIGLAFGCGGERTT